MTVARDQARRAVIEPFEKGLARFDGQAGPRLGCELKFPLVDASGAAAGRDGVESLWRHLVERGWTAQVEDGALVGATRPGDQNDTVGSSETGHCKTEFSLAHVDGLDALEASWREIRRELASFTEESGLHFLGFGLQPVTPPSSALKVRKQRANVWQRICRSNEVIPEEDGDDMDLFTVNAGSHVHVSLGSAEAVRAVNVLNGFAPAQIALSADGNVWRGAFDPDHQSVGEAFWDWWRPARGRVGIPAEPFRDIGHYADAIAALPLLYVKRESGPVTFETPPSLSEFLAKGSDAGSNGDGQRIEVSPEPADVDLHNSCYWYNARISRYYTVENRVHDQQGPEDLLTPSVLTLGLVSALPEAEEVLATQNWNDLREARPASYRSARRAEVNGDGVDRMIGQMLDVCELGLRRRGQGEERFLTRARERFRRGETPADEAERIVREQGIEGLVRARSVGGSGGV